MGESCACVFAVKRLSFSWWPLPRWRESKQRVYLTQKEGLVQSVAVRILIGNGTYVRIMEGDLKLRSVLERKPEERCWTMEIKFRAYMGAMGIDRSNTHKKMVGDFFCRFFF